MASAGMHAMRLFSNAIRVRVSPEAFTFSMDGSTQLLPTFLYLHDAPEGVRVISVGESPEQPSPGAVRVDVFGPATRLGRGERRVSNFELLEAYLRYAIQKLGGRKWLVRPGITVIGAESLDAILHGFQVPLLRQAFESAGAHSVEFADGHAA